MGRILSPVLHRELENLDKDADSRKNAMKALKSYVKDLDSKAIPHFLAQVSKAKEPGSTSGEYTISLYEVLARVHGRNIVPQIDNIMSTIIRTLSLSAGCFPLHQACSKVVPAIARYGIDPSMPQEEKTRIIGSLCRPLSEVLMGSPESLASGAALCLKTLVESDNWRFASNDMVNEVCLKVAGALEDKPSQTNAHMGLVMTISKHNSLIIEAYARSLLRSGLQVLAAGIAEGNSQKRFTAVQMINFLMKCVDSRSISSELAKVVEVMENCQTDPMPFVKGAAFEALQTAKMVAVQKEPKYEFCSSPNFSANFSRDLTGTGVNGSPSSWLVSPESQTVDSFLKYDALVESPISTGQSSSNGEYARRTNRRLWNNESGGVDVSLKDGLFPGSNSGSNGFNNYFKQINDGEVSNGVKEQSGTFSGFVESKVKMMAARGTTPSPQRPRSPLTIDDVKIFTTPRKLVRSLQGPTDANSGFLEKKHDRVRSSNPRELKWKHSMEVNGDRYSHNYAGRDSEIMTKQNGFDNVGGTETVSDNSESVSSNGDAPTETTTCKVSCDTCGVVKNGVQNLTMRSRCSKATLSLICGLSLLLPAIVASVMWTESEEDFFNVVPT